MSVSTSLFNKTFSANAEFPVGSPRSFETHNNTFVRLLKKPSPIVAARISMMLISMQINKMIPRGWITHPN